jgi:hypothetical protein
MKLAPLLLGLFLTTCSRSKAPETSIFGAPLFVNDQRVRDDEIKLALIYGPGRMALELRKIGLIIEEEIARQVKAGRARPVISDAEFETEYQYWVDEFTQCYPMLDIGGEICRAYRSVDGYRDFLRQQMLFERVFLPEDPAQWPRTTLESVRDDPAAGEALITEEKESYAKRLAQAGGDPKKLPRGDAVMREFLRQIVREALFDRIEFKTQPDIGDSKLALWADTNGDGKPELAVTIDALWEKVSDTVTDTEIQEAKQWCITARATRDRLASEGGLLSKREAEEALVDLVTGLAGTATSLEQLATKTYEFPSLESFREYYALQKGFERLIAPRLADGPNGELAPALKQHFERANKVMGLGMVDAEVLLVSAMDIPRFRWKKDGWSEARRKAQRLREEYEKDPTPEHWSRLLDQHSEYWDPPPNARGNGGWSSDRVHKRQGRFGSRYRNDLIRYVGESSYTEWVTGESITDWVFFDQPENSITGPFRGPLGWYLTRVTRRTPPSRPLKLDDPDHRRLLREDYLRHAFVEYSKEAVARAKIRGWKLL